MGFFTLLTLTFRVLHCFFVIEHGRHKILYPFQCRRTPDRPPTAEEASSLRDESEKVIVVPENDEVVVLGTPAIGFGIGELAHEGLL
jgi:hypothetical protein